MILNITLPQTGDLLIEPGDYIDFGAPIIKTYKKQEVQIPLAKMLGVNAKKIFHHLKKFVGEQIKKGDFIAENKTMMSRKRYFSEYDGILKEINHHDGYIVLEVDSPEQLTNNAFFKGEVVGTNGDTIQLNVQHYKEFPIVDASQFFGGEVFFYNRDQAQSITEDNVMNKIAISMHIPTIDQVKLDTLGVNGFICTHPLADSTSSPYARLQDPFAVEEMVKLQYPYCTVDKSRSIIYVYT